MTTSLYTIIYHYIPLYTIIYHYIQLYTIIIYHYTIILYKYHYSHHLYIPLYQLPEKDAEKS